MGRAKLLFEREKSKIDLYLSLQLSKRLSIHGITTYIANQSSYGKKCRGRTRATIKYDDRRLLRKAIVTHV